MILTSFLLMASSSTRVSVLGAGQLRFSTGHAVAFANAVTLRANDAGLLGDTVGRPVLPEIRVSGPFTVSMNGTVKVSGHAVGRLVLQTKDGEIGFPGEGTMGVLQVVNAQIGGARAEGGNVPPARQPSIATHQSGPVTVSIHPRSLVSSDRVVLGDVADVTGDADGVERLKTVDLGETPGLGSRRTLTRWGIQSALRNAGIVDSAVDLRVPLDATVSRKGQTVSIDDFVSAAKEKAKEEFGEAKTSLTGYGPSPLIAPIGDLAINAASTRNGDKITVELTVTVDGVKVDTRRVTLVADIQHVLSGQAVHVAVSRNGAVLETEGRAKSAGYVGETIQVQTADGATLTATIIDSSNVEVRL